MIENMLLLRQVSQWVMLIFSMVHVVVGNSNHFHLKNNPKEGIIKLMKFSPMCVCCGGGDNFSACENPRH